jgi:hypothetical protein
VSEPTRTDLQCPFEDFLDRRILGDLSTEERAKLDDHVAQGCATCAPRYQSEQHLENLVQSHVDRIATEAEKSRGFVLDKVREQIAREGDRKQNRRFRRLALNALLFLFVLGGIALLSTEYVMVAALGRKLVKAQRELADTEIHAVLVALKRYHDEHGTLPKTDVELVKALGTARNDGRIYYAVERVDDDGRLLDPWKHPYVYRADGTGVWLSSNGANGRDEAGIGDDVVRQLIVK